MALRIDPKLEARLLKRAKEAGLSVAEFIESLLGAEDAARNELETLALEGLNSGEAIPVGPGYWEEKHRRLDERLKGGILT